MEGIGDGVSPVPNGEMSAAPVPRADGWEYVQWLLGRRRRFVVRENSMVPTLMPGDTVLAAMGPVGQVGDIAIAPHPTRPNFLLIKRIQAIFPDGGVYLISDNTQDPSVRDSRHFGVIAASHMLGRVTSRLAAAV